MNKQQVVKEVVSKKECKYCIYDNDCNSVEGKNSQSVIDAPCKCYEFTEDEIDVDNYCKDNNINLEED